MNSKKTQSFFSKYYLFDYIPKLGSEYHYRGATFVAAASATRGRAWCAGSSVLRQERLLTTTRGWDTGPGRHGSDIVIP